MEISVQNVVKGISYGFLEKSFEFWFVSLFSFVFTRAKTKNIHTWIFFTASPAFRVVAVLESTQLSPGRNCWTSH